MLATSYPPWKAMTLALGSLVVFEGLKGTPCNQKRKLTVGHATDMRGSG